MCVFSFLTKLSINIEREYEYSDWLTSTTIVMFKKNAEKSVINRRSLSAATSYQYIIRINSQGLSMPQRQQANPGVVFVVVTALMHHHISLFSRARNWHRLQLSGPHGLLGGWRSYGTQNAQDFAARAQQWMGPFGRKSWYHSHHCFSCFFVYSLFGGASIVKIARFASYQHCFFPEGKTRSCTLY